MRTRQLDDGIAHTFVLVARGNESLAIIDFQHSSDEENPNASA